MTTQDDNKLISRSNGTSQSQRLAPALLPSSVSIEERTTEDLLQFLQHYAKGLNFYNDDNNVSGDWGHFFSAIANESSALISDEQLRKMLVSFMQNPEGAFDNSKNLPLLSQPHIALLLTFFNLLQYPLAQFNNLTARNLDFYYQKILQLHPKAAQADKVNVVFTLQQQQKIHQLPKGTLLNAGKNSSGQALEYALMEDVFLTQANVSEVKTLYCDIQDKALTDQAGDDETSHPIAVLVSLIRWALGDPIQGGAIPEFYNEAFDGDKKLINRKSLMIVADDITVYRLWSVYKSIKNYLLEPEKIAVENKQYVLKTLYFASLTDFCDCFDHVLQSSGDEINWEEITKKIENAYFKKTIISFIKLYEILVNSEKANLSTKQQAYLTSYVLDTACFHSVNQFKTCLTQMLNNSNLLITNRENKPVVQWQTLTEKWQSIFDNGLFSYLNEFYQENINVKGFYVAKRISKGAYIHSECNSKQQKTFSTTGFKTFGYIERTNTKAVAPLGFAMSSPVLELSEGKRTINVLIEGDGFDYQLLKSLLKVYPQPFEVYLSNLPNKLTKNIVFDYGNFISSDALQTYDTQAIQLLCNIKDVKGIDFTKKQYLHFPDGMLYKIEQKQGYMITLQAAGSLPNDCVIKIYDKLTFKEQGQPLSELTRDNEDSSLVRVSNNISNPFNANDVGKFIVWQADGKIDIIIKVVDSYSARVESWGYLSEYKAEKNLKYDNLTLNQLTDLNWDWETNFIEAVQLTNNQQFSDDDLGKMLRWNNGKLFKLKNVSGTKAEIEVYTDKILAPTNQISLYSQDTIFLNALKISIDLDETVAPIKSGPTAAEIDYVLTETYPVLQLMLKNTEDLPVDCRTLLQDFCIKKIALQVSAQEMTNLKLRNDSVVLRTNTVFEPFSDKPQINSGFYFTHPEIGQKKLDSLSLEMQWSDIPDKFAESYSVQQNDEKLKFKAASFTASLKFSQNEFYLPLLSPAESIKKIFVDNQDKLHNSIVLTYTKFNYPEYFKVQAVHDSSNTDPFAWPFYFKLELQSPDFQHKLYADLLNKIALNAATGNQEANKAYKLQAPYTPRLQNFKISYKASELINFAEIVQMQSASSFIHIHPFGYTKHLEENCSLLPRYNKNGYLFVGLNDLTSATTNNLLFQLIEGGGNPTLLKPRVDWFYLNANNTWQPLRHEHELLVDATNGLRNTGIMKIGLPDNSELGNQLFLNQNYWLMACVLQDAAAIADTVAIIAQAATAIFEDQTSAGDNDLRLLPPNSIQSLVKQNAAIANVQQPYSSFDGKPQENKEAFAIRVSERLRHKQRALTAWDYERLVLAAFPEIYQVKCIEQTRMSGRLGAAEITLLIIPDIINRTPRFVLQPKTSLDLLEKIKNYLQDYVSPFIKLIVKNPNYETLYCTMSVHFKSTERTDELRKRLNQHIKQFLSPWAYAKEVNIAFGNRIYKAALISFIESEAYVDYVSDLILYRDIHLIDDDFVSASNSNAILVSAMEHGIKIIN